MKLAKPVIPIHKLQDRTDSGIEIRHIISETKHAVPTDAHRDDYYIFLIQENGTTELIIDFNKIILHGHAMFYLLPGQIHEVPRTSALGGWFMAIDTEKVDSKYRILFEEIITQQCLSLKDGQSDQLKKCASLLAEMIASPVSSSTVQPAIIDSLASAFIGMIAEIYEANEPEHKKENSRPDMITREFKKLLRLNFKTVKNPSEYASLLCLSLSYLNEVVKAMTGFPVSYLIHQEIILEAKRLLYYSELSVKEIAFSLGYEDHAYFSRLFVKVVGHSPAQFRKVYRK